MFLEKNKKKEDCIEQSSQPMHITINVDPAMR